MTAFGIDFGTTNSAVAVMSDGEVEVIRIDTPPVEWEQFGYDRVFPTVFGYGQNREPLFGWAAKQLETDTKIEAVKRLFATEDQVTIGDEQFLVDEIATMLFAQLKRSAAAESGHEMDRAVVTIPANSRGRARQRTKVCAGMGGIDVLALMNEPTAAAMAAMRRNREDQTVMVIDWGGGTLDVTVLEAIDGTFMEQSSAGIQRSGGVDFDSMIMKWLAESTPGSESWTGLQRSMLRLDVEKAKMMLSSQDEVNVPLPGGDIRRLSRGEFEQIANPLVEQLRIPIERCMRDIAALSVQVDSLVLAGGTCKIPAVRSLAEQITGLTPVSGVDPLTAIAEGAAVAAAIMQGELPDYGFFVSTEHALGTRVLTGAGTLEFSPIIPRGHKLPAERTELYSPVKDDQDSLDFEVIEGDPDLPLNHEENVVLAKWNIDVPNPGPMDEVSWGVTYKYDLDGIVNIEVIDERDHSALFSGEIALGVQRDGKQMVGIAKRVETTLNEGVVQTSTVDFVLESHIAEAVLNARNKVAPFVDDEEATEIRDLCRRIEESGGSDQDLVDQLEAINQKYRYLF